jgi:hypothetical protein
MYDEKRFLLIETALVAEKIMRKEPVLLIKFSPLPGIFYGIKKNANAIIQSGCRIADRCPSLSLSYPP